MNGRDLRKVLGSSDFLDEIHHLYWIDAFENNGRSDAGLNCRDHAFAVALLCQIMGYEAVCVHGRAVLVLGERNGRPPVGHAHDPHSWVALRGKGYVDLSLKPEAPEESGWEGIPLRAVVYSHWLPKGQGKVVVAHDESAYENALARASYLARKATLVYLGTEYSVVTPATVRRAFECINSPLTDRLAGSFSGDVYSSAVLHLYDLIRGRATPVRNLPKDEAWRAVANGYPRALDEVIRLARL